MTTRLICGGEVRASVDYVDLIIGSLLKRKQVNSWEPIQDNQLPSHYERIVEVNAPIAPNMQDMIEGLKDRGEKKNHPFFLRA